MDKFITDLTAALSNPALWEEFRAGTWETLYSTVIATFMACVLGLVLGVLLVVGEKDGIRPLPAPVMRVLNFVINILRSVPFLILMLMVLPLSKLLLNTSIGTPASIPPLIIAAAPFVARLVETSLREVDKGVIEAAQSMGCSPFQIIWKVILPESLPSLVAGAMGIKELDTPALFQTLLLLALSLWGGAAAVGLLVSRPAARKE